MENFVPFLWITGQKHDFEEEIAAISRAGMKSFCVESRIHPDFCGETWWQDFDGILRLAEKYDMSVWILDDKRFPTGNANDGLAARPELRQWHIVADNRDVVSDGFPLQAHIGADKEDELLCALAFPYEKDRLNVEKPAALTEKASGEWLLFSLPKGIYRLVLIYKSRRGAGLENYIDMLNPDSVDLLVKNVYEKFYERYPSLFGTRIVGFFSDEPCFGDGYTDKNLSTTNYYQHNTGILGAAYPYSAEILKNMNRRLPDFRAEDLAALWYPTKNHEEIRCVYMDEITNGYSEHFSKRLGAWCRRHNTEYAGHIIEDMNAHMHTGCSAGHYFRSQTGQTLAGIDVVLHQIKPYSMSVKHIAPVASGCVDPCFFTHTLPALAVSDAWLDENKRGSVCEIFGAYGWGESIRDMKWLLDVMLAAGIDHFIPHAFCPDENNEDCPPHFYEAGKNPLYKPFSALIAYAEKIISLTRRRKKPKVGILYHAEAEWSGKACHPVDLTAKQLNQRQIPFLIIPYEKLLDSGAETIIVPAGEYLPPWVENELIKAKTQGILVLGEAETNFDELKKSSHGKCFLENTDIGLRILDGEAPLLFQTQDAGTCDSVYVEDGENFILYDPMNDTKTPVGQRFRLSLKAGETRILLKGTCPQTEYFEQLDSDEFYEFETSPSVPVKETKMRAGSLNALFPDFSGSVDYAQNIQFFESGDYEWRFENIGGALELFIDGDSCGFRFIAPAIYRVRGIKSGIHRVCYRFYNTLANTQKDIFSDYSCIEAFGLLARPKITRFIG